MLLKPPTILDDVISQESEQLTNKTRNNLPKPSKNKKQTTLRLTQFHQQKRQNNDKEDDAQSFHSNASRNSKPKLPKQSSIGRQKKSSFKEAQDTKSVQKKQRNAYEKYQDDNKSVNSVGSKHSNKNKKKENTLGRQKVPNQNKNSSNNFPLSFKDAIDEPEQSVIKIYNEKSSPKIIKYHPQQIDTKNLPDRVDFNNLSDDQGQVFKIDQKNVQKMKPIVVGKGFSQDNKVQNHNLKNRTIQESCLNATNLNETKSRRRNIFGNKMIDNSSKMLSSMGQQSVVVGETSRRKSRSRLKQIFNKSQQKVNFDENQSNFSLIGALNSQSRALPNMKPTVGNNLNNQFYHLQKKVLNEDNDNFGEQSVRSELNLSQSQLKNKQIDKDKDSLIFQFEPQKKKGLSLAQNTKVSGVEQKSNQLPIINQNLTSKDINNNLIVIDKNLVSKKIQVERILKQNQQYISQAAIIQENASNQKDQANKFTFQIEDGQKLTNNYEKKQATTKEIRKVDRNQIKINNKEMAEEQTYQKEILTKARPDKKGKTQPIVNNIVMKQQRQNINDTFQNNRGENKSKENLKSKQPIIEQTKAENIDIIQKVIEKNTIQDNQTNKLPLFSKAPSTIGNHISDNQSQKSTKSIKKGKEKKQSSIGINRTHKVQLRNQSPRAEQSFYEESEVQKFLKTKDNEKVQENKKSKLMTFSDEQNNINQKIKSKTDINFYDYSNSQKSIKPPSSKPPLSKKSNVSSSKSKSKAKENTLNITMKNRQYQVKEEPKQKKLTLFEKAKMKHNQNSGGESNSQDSFRSRQNFSEGSKDSKDSNQSKKSKNSLKKESTIKINSQFPRSKLPPQVKKISNLSSQQESDIDNQLEQQKWNDRDKIVQRRVQERIIVSKNCTFIDEKGKLVQKDLIIQGNKTRSRQNLKDVESQVFDRMRRSREAMRSRSKSRQNKSSLSKRTSKMTQNDSYYEDSSNFTTSNYYDSETSWKRQIQSNNNALKQFIKPVEHVPVYRQQAKIQKLYYEEKPQKITLNDMFGRKTTNQSNLAASRSRKSLHRTEQSFSKKQKR